MKFLVDAQLPARLASFHAEHGHDALHVSRLPGASRTPDPEIARVADAEDRVVITKDADFRHSHTVQGSPRKLLVVGTGNITNNALLELFATHLEDIVAG